MLTTTTDPHNRWTKKRGQVNWAEVKADLAQSPPPPGPQSAPPTVSGISPSTGPVTGGTQVTITGNHFQGAANVQIGDLSASFQIVNDHTIVAVTPNISAEDTLACAHGAGSSDIQVAVGASLSQPSPADVFTYTDPLPHQNPVCVTSISPRFGPTVGGTQITLKGWGFTGVTSVGFSDETDHIATEASSFTVIDANTITVTTPPAYLLGESIAEVSVIRGVGDGSGPNKPFDEYTYTGVPPEPPPPTVTGLSTHGGPVAGGTTVAITGTGFSNARSLSFGRFPQGFASSIFNFTIVNDNTITVVSPPEYSLQTVDVAVFGPGGDSLAVPADQFTYDTPPTPPPTITGVSPASGPTTGGNTVTVTGNGFTGLTSLQVGPTLITAGSGAFTVVNDNTVTCTAPPEASGTVDVIARTPVGFSLLSPADSYTYQ
jgi:hypothetical protein